MKTLKVLFIEAEDTKYIIRVLQSPTRRVLKTIINEGTELYWIQSFFFMGIEDTINPAEHFNDKRLFEAGINHIITYIEVPE